MRRKLDERLAALSKDFRLNAADHLQCGDNCTVNCDALLSKTVH